MRLRSSFLALVATLALLGCAPRSSAPTPTPGPVDPSGAFLSCAIDGGGGTCRLGVGSLEARVSLSLEGQPLELGVQGGGATCAGVVGGARCDLGTVPAGRVYSLPYLGKVRAARAALTRPDGSTVKLAWP